MRRGRIVRPNHLFAKISRPEVAAQFMAPAPEAMLDALVREGRLTSTEAEAAQYAPVAEDVTAEADSGGHTDNRPLAVLLPLLSAGTGSGRRAISRAAAVRVGAAGGLGHAGRRGRRFRDGRGLCSDRTINQTARNRACPKREGACCSKREWRMWRWRLPPICSNSE